MDFPAIWGQLQDLPPTFRRDGQPYSWLIDSITAGLYMFCQAGDALQNQYNYNTSQEGWIDVWGGLAGIQRNTNESNVVYLNRIQQTVLAWRDSLVAIEKFTATVENITTTVLERSPVGYTIYFPTAEDIPTIRRVILDLKYIRPAGVPFLVQSQIGTYLNTINYYGTVGNLKAATVIIGRVTGAYLGDNAPIQLNIPASTNSAQSLIPDLLFVDPTLNP